MKLPMIEFPYDCVRTKNCFKDESVLDEIHNKCSPLVFLPKVEETYGKVAFPVQDEYPYRFASIALSMDGKMAFPDRPEGVLIAKGNTLNAEGALTDFYVLNFLRAYSDGVINGTNTLVSEPNLWMTIQDQQLKEDRQNYFKNKMPNPSNMIISKDGRDIPFHHQIFNQQLVPISIFTSPNGWDYIEKEQKDKFYLLGYVRNSSEVDKVKFEKALKSCGEQIPVIVTGKNDEPDVDMYMKTLKAAGMDHLLIESPTLMWLLMQNKGMEEIFITHTTTFIGGQLTPGYQLPFTFDQHPQSQIAQLNHHENSFIFTRQILSYEG